jgi:hypothetical protein
MGSDNVRRYFFDIRDENGVWPDDEGMELPTIESAEKEAVRSLAGIAQSEVVGKRRHEMAIEVRTDKGPLFRAAIAFDIKSIQ